VLCPRRIDALTITCDANAYIPWGNPSQTSIVFAQRPKAA
jgi:hypothetical protein